MTRDEILTLYAYNAWANTRTLESAGELSPEAFTRDLGSSFPSVRDTLAHILGAEWVWLKRWQGESPDRLLGGAEFPSLASLHERFAAVEAERRGVLVGLPDEQLSGSFDYQDLAGRALRLPYLASMQHVVNHGSYHRGQVATLLRQLGATPISTDLSRYHLELPKGS